MSDAALLAAALDDAERAVLGRFVVALREAYGGDLHAVWLYGSRARGERTHDESDVDVLVITRTRRDDLPLHRLADEIRDELGAREVILEPRQRTLAWVEDRRRIRSFFVQEVDRDKIVLYGEP